VNQNNNNIIIFRKRVLPYSETFIADQGRYLSKYRAIFTGFNLDQSGLTLLQSSPRRVLEELSYFHGLHKLLFRSGFSVKSRWLNSLIDDNPKLIHAHFLNDGLDAITLARRLNIPAVTTLHGHDITKPRQSRRLINDGKVFFTGIDKVIAVSDYIAQHALAKGCPEKKLVKHSIGIDLERFSLEKSESKQPSLLFVGRLVEKKGCTYLLQAMHQLKKKYNELSLTIVGDGKLKESLQSQSTELELNVNFVGKQSAQQIKKWLSKSWLFVAPSVTADNGDAEGLGMVFLEAQALYTPVVSFRSGGIVEAIEDEKTGLLCDEKDVLSLADNIDVLLSNESLRKKMGQQGRERVERYFDVRKQCKILESIYDDVCAQS